MSKNPKVRKSTSSPGPAKPTKKFKANMTTLDTYSSTRALNQTLMSTVKKLYETRDITNVKTAKAAMELLKANDIKTFTKKFASISKLVSNKSQKNKVKKDAKDAIEQEKLTRSLGEWRTSCTSLR